MKFLIVISIVLCSAKLSLSDTLDLNEVLSQIIEGVSAFAKNDDQIADAAEMLASGGIGKLLKDYIPALDLAAQGYASQEDAAGNTKDVIQSVRSNVSANGMSELYIPSDLLDAVTETITNVTTLFDTFVSVTHRTSQQIEKILKTAVIENGVFKINSNFLNETVKLEVYLYGFHAKMIGLENEWLVQFQKTEDILDTNLEANYVPAYVIHSIRTLITDEGEGLRKIEGNLRTLITGLENLHVTVNGKYETIPIHQFDELVEQVEQANADTYHTTAAFVTKIKGDLKGILNYIKPKNN